MVLATGFSDSSVNNAIRRLQVLMNTCPCCSAPLLRHARRGEIYWFCPHCRQEMPNLSSAILGCRHSIEVVTVSGALVVKEDMLKAS